MPLLAKSTKAALENLNIDSSRPTLNPSVVSYKMQLKTMPRNMIAKTGQICQGLINATAINIVVREARKAANIQNVIVMAISISFEGTPVKEIANQAPPATIAGAINDDIKVVNVSGEQLFNPQ